MFGDTDSKIDWLVSGVEDQIELHDRLLFGDSVEKRVVSTDVMFGLQV